LLTLFIHYIAATPGQAVKDFGTNDLMQDRPDLPWKQIAGMRNIIAHEYLGIDMTIAWEVVEIHIAPLKNAITDLAKEMEILLNKIE
jgi:uncharacterized protein with HEPN domain